MSAPHILLVDDDLALLQALPHLVSLRIHGVQVDTSDSAQEALEQIQEHDYDVIVSDIKMPGMDGLELLAKIQALHPEIPILIITGHADPPLITQALRTGAYDFIQKPIDRVYFVAALHRAIQTRQLRRQVQEQQRALEQRAQSMEQLVEQRTRELIAANEAREALARNLLDLSLIETNQLVLHRSRCDLVELCQHVLDAYTLGADLAITFEFSESTVEVEVDRERIGQVLIHLLSNARKYSPHGSPVTITLHQASDEVTLVVHDQGVGIAEERLPHIFERFYRVPEGEVQAGVHPGVGLGLYLAQYLIELHGGRIEVQSSPGQGSTFSVVLPRWVETAGEHADEVTPAEASFSPFEPPKWLVS